MRASDPNATIWHHCVIRDFKHNPLYNLRRQRPVDFTSLSSQYVHWQYRYSSLRWLPWQANQKTMPRNVRPGLHERRLIDAAMLQMILLTAYLFVERIRWYPLLDKVGIILVLPSYTIPRYCVTLSGHVSSRHVSSRPCLQSAMSPVFDFKFGQPFDKNIFI